MTVVLCLLLVLFGLSAGAILFRKARAIPSTNAAQPIVAITIIIPARNEEENLPLLLASIQRSTTHPTEVVVVDDDSTDRTAEIARSYGATVLTSAPKPADWRGKPWAGWQGANQAKTAALFFLDADTQFTRDGLQRIYSLYSQCPSATALSVLPYSQTKKPYEELSLFFNLLLAAGAGRFSGLNSGRLFGQSLLIDRSLYFEAGGHESVRMHVLENLYLAPRIEAHGGHLQTALGKGTLEMRMFSEGLGQLHSSWKKGFADGARATPAINMFLSIVWLSAATLPIITLVFGSGTLRMVSAGMYLACALEIAILARKLGTYRWLTALVYFVPLIFYFVLFAESLLARGRSSVIWKGRPV